MVSMDAPYENEQETGSIGSGDPLSDAVSKVCVRHKQEETQK